MNSKLSNLARASLIAALLAIAAGCTPEPDTTPQQQSALANPAVPLYDDLGDYHYEVTISTALAQRYFDQGLRLYYAFNHAEAIRAFREAQRLDPNCAMCWWAEALAWGPNINLPMDEPSALAAHAASEGALARKASSSEKEQALIDALAVRYASTPPTDRSALDLAYANAMAEVTARFPEDLDIGVLYAESLMDLRPWDYWTDDRQPQPGMEFALAQLEKAMAANEEHPGACHFYIHAVEAVFPERAIPCAERLAALMPGAGHLVHMPGHIYIRVGRYLDAVAANEHAVHADETYILDQNPGMGMYTAGYYPHNYDFMAFAAMMIGRSQMAIDSAEKVTSLLPPEMFGSPGMDFLQHWSVRPLLMQVRFAQWDALLALPEPPAGRPYAQAIWHYARGRASLARGDIEAANQELMLLKATAAEPAMAGLRMEFNQATDLAAIAEQVLTGWRDATAGDYPAAIAALRSAVQLEDDLFYGEPPEWSVPPRQDLGEVLLLAGQYADAEQAFREDLELFPENGWSLHGLIKALRAQNEDAEAAELESTFTRVWATADVTLD